MELDDLKNTWRVYDAKLEKSMKLNMHILKIMDLDKTRTALKKFIMTPFLGVIIGIVLQVMLGSFIYNHISMPEFVIPAALIYLFALMQTIFGIYQSSVVLQIDYDMTVTGIQKKLEIMKIHRIRYLTITRFAYAILWVPVLIVGVRVFFDGNLYQHLDNTWLLVQALLGLACIIFAIRLSQQYAAQKITSPLLNKLVGNISINDFTGRSLVSAISFLNEIETFENEE